MDLRPYRPDRRSWQGRSVPTTTVRMAPSDVHADLEAVAAELRRQWAAAMRVGDFTTIDGLVQASYAVERALVALEPHGLAAAR